MSSLIEAFTLLKRSVLWMQTMGLGRRWLVLWLGCFASLFLYSGAVYGLLHGVWGQQLVFAALYRMYLYHEAYAVQYIALFCAVHATVVTVALRWVLPSTRRGRWMVALGTLLATTVVASVLGGVLWKVHDMMAGYFPPAERLWNDLLWGAETGFYVGWQLLALSQPYSSLCLVGFVWVTLQCCQWAQRLRRAGG